MKFKGLYTAVVTALVIGCSLFTYRMGRELHAGYRALFPDVAVVKTEFPVAVRKEGKRIIYRFEKKRPAQWCALRQIPRQAVAAVLMAEDSGFFQHRGYDPDAIRAAWEHNHRPGVKVKRGGS